MAAAESGMGVRTASMGWAQPGEIEEDTGDVLFLRDAQPIKGDSRRKVIVVRFGDFCAVYGARR
jgi:hypothetical protein